MDLPERGQYKKEAYKLIKTNDNITTLTKAILMICEAHYYRSKEGYQKYHPGFDTFAKHWLHSDIT